MNLHLLCYCRWQFDGGNSRPLWSLEMEDVAALISGAVHTLVYGTHLFFRNNPRNLCHLPVFPPIFKEVFGSLLLHFRGTHSKVHTVWYGIQLFLLFNGIQDQICGHHMKTKNVNFSDKEGSTFFVSFSFTNEVFSEFKALRATLWIQKLHYISAAPEPFLD